MRVNTNRRNPGAVVRHIVERLENADAPQQQRRRRRPPWRRGADVAEPRTEHRGAADPGGPGRPSRRRAS